MKSYLALAAIALFGMAAANADTFLVLPFFNASKDANLDWIGESISETMRETLASQGLMTLDRDDREEAYRRLELRPNAHPTRATMIKIGQALDADEIIYGEFDLIPPPKNASSTSRGSLKMRAHILDLRHFRQGPEFGEVGALEDLASEQAHLAWQALQFIEPKSAPSEAEFRAERPRIRIEAIESYIRGLLATDDDMKRKLFTQAVRIEPHYSQPCYELGMLAYSKKDYAQAADWLQKVAKDDLHYRQANFFLGICRYKTGDYAAAKAAFAMVAEEVPLNEVYNNLGAAESRLNEPDALDSFAKALGGDPTDPTYHFNVGYALWRQGKFDAAAERFRAALDRDPQDAEAKMMLGRCLQHAGPRPGDDRTEGLERLKTNYEESAYWQLKAALQPRRK
jgi:tetratricopeptide (TPR) repeat protein